MKTPPKAPKTLAKTHVGKSPTPRQRTAKQAKNSANCLPSWLRDARVLAFLGRALEIKLRVLALAITGSGSVTSIARDFGISRQAIERHVRRCRSAFGHRQQNVAPVDSANRV